MLSFWLTIREYMRLSAIALWRQTVQGYNMTREQLEMMVFLISGNCKGVELLMSMLEEKEEGIEEKVGQSLRLLMVDLVEKKKLDPDIIEQLLKSLADRKFFLSLELRKFAVKVAVSMNRYQLVADILSQGKVKVWLVEKDEECFLRKLCWDVGLSCDPAGLAVLLGHCSCWPDGCQEDVGEEHGAVHEAAGGGGGHAGEAGGQLGDSKKCPLV